MIIKLDTTYLSPHSATLAWWDRREKCERCAHLSLTLEGQKDRTQVLRCKAVRAGKGRQAYAYCIDAREGACGPTAKFFKETTT